MKLTKFKIILERSGC